MNNTEETALRIAKLLGYESTEDDQVFKKGNDYWAKEQLIMLYGLMYDRLMDIVFECNTEGDYRINITYRTVSITDSKGTLLLPHIFYSKKLGDRSLTGALQIVCLKYLEMKNDTDRN